MSNEREQALFAAIDGGDLDCGARNHLGGEPALAGARDAAGVSASLHARYRGRSDIADALVAAAPTIDIFDAAAAGRVADVARCLDRGARRREGVFGRRLHRACTSRHSSIDPTSPRC